MSEHLLCAHYPTNQKPFYSESEYQLTSTLSVYDSWGIDEISQRQKELSDLALIAWPV
jgi:hypothetical protein